MLTDRQKELMPRVVEMYLNEEKVPTILKALKTSKDTYYAIINSEEFKGELGKVKDSNLRKLKIKMMNNSVKDYDSLRVIADSTDDEKLKTQILMYLIDHNIGRATNKVEQTVKEDNKEDTITDLDSMLEDIQKDIESDNVIDLEEKKKAK